MHPSAKPPGSAFRSSVTLLFAMALLVTTAPASVHAKNAAKGPVTFQGRFFESASRGDPVACAPESCQAFRIPVHPSRGGARAPLEFAIRWPSEYDDFDLHVFRPGGREVPRAGGRVGSAEAVHDRRPVRGVYRVVVTADRVTDSAFEGVVQIENRKPLPGPRRELLPNLRTLPPRNFHISVPSGYEAGDPVPSADESCYQDETEETGVGRCLRFDNVIANSGRGELRMRFLLSGVGGDQRMQQVVDMSRGAPRYREAGTYVWHESHRHAHYEEFAGYRLLSVDSEGDVTNAVGEGMKAGFCLQDTELTWWRRRGNAPTTFTFPACTAPHEQDSDGTWGVMGISRGWADVYTWDLPDQYVPLDGVPEGTYVLETVADAASRVKETNEADNMAWALIRITGSGVELLESASGTPPASFA